MEIQGTNAYLYYIFTQNIYSAHLYKNQPTVYYIVNT